MLFFLAAVVFADWEGVDKYAIGSIITALGLGVYRLYKLTISKKQVVHSIDRTDKLDAAEGWRNIAEDFKIRNAELQNREDRRDKEHAKEIEEQRRQNSMVMAQLSRISEQYQRVLIWIEYLQETLKEHDIPFRPWNPDGTGPHPTIKSPKPEGEGS